MTKTQAAVRLRNAVASLLSEIGEEHDGWHLEPPQEEMTMEAKELLGKHKGSGIRESDYDDKLSAARDAVIEAAGDWVDAGHNDSEERADLVAAVDNLRKLETPPDPLGPVKEFVRDIQKCGKRTMAGEFISVLVCPDELSEVAKALGMEKESPPDRPDPLGPVREFVRIARLGCIGNGYLEKLEAAAKALGMEAGK